MLELADASQPPAGWQQPGGFCWWYAECMDDDGNGIVLIWAFGLPFLPGHAQASRDGHGRLPQDAPSLNVVVYQRGEPVFYALRALRHATWSGAHADDAHLDAPRPDALRPASTETWQFGETRITAERTQHDLAVRVDLAVPVAGEAEPLRGTVLLAGRAARTHGVSLGLGASAHRWTPLLGPSFASATLHCGTFHMRLQGRGYHDRNASPLPLHALGIRTWIWARAALPDRERIVYALWPEPAGPPRLCGLDVLDSGEALAVTALELQADGAHTTAFGMPAWQRLRVTRQGAPWLDLRLTRRVDNGPFYLRYLAEARGAQPATDRQVHAATAEIIVPARIDLAQHRPFVRMRVSPVRGQPSLWLPLFEGPRATRWQRLLRHWLGQTPTQRAPAVQRELHVEVGSEP